MILNRECNADLIHFNNFFFKVQNLTNSCAINDIALLKNFCLKCYSCFFQLLFNSYVHQIKSIKLHKIHLKTSYCLHLRPRNFRQNYFVLNFEKRNRKLNVYLIIIFFLIYSNIYNKRYYI